MLVDKNIKFKTPILRSDFGGYNDTYIVVKGTIDLEVAGNNAMTQKFVIFENNSPFRSCISDVCNILIGNAKDVDFLVQNIIY